MQSSHNLVHPLVLNFAARGKLQRLLKREDPLLGEVCRGLQSRREGEVSVVVRSMRVSLSLQVVCWKVQRCYILDK